MAFSVHLQVAAWAVWDGQDATLQVGGAVSPRPSLPLSLRRRVSAIGRRALEAAWAVLPDDLSPRLVLASRHGEYSRTFDLLSGLTMTGEVSPADFSLAVHHALVGLLSIATGNREGHTAVAAGRESLGYGLLEAATFVAEQGHPALMVYYDEPLPEGYAPVVAGDCASAMALAVLLVPPSWPQSRTLVMNVGTLPQASGADLPRAFVRVLQEGGEAIARGDRHDWQWHHEA